MLEDFFEAQDEAQEHIAAHHSLTYGSDGKAMSFYQELQLSQAGSKAYIKSFSKPKDKFKHTLIFLLKIALSISFCIGFISLFILALGSENSAVGFVVLVSVLVFRYSDLGIKASHSALGILIVFAILAVGPRLANILPLGWAFCVNSVCILAIVVIGCHNVNLGNHSTLALSYVLLLYFDVSGTAYIKRVIGLAAGAVAVALIVYFKHRKIEYDCTFKSIFKEFDLSSERTRWQIRFTFCLSSVLLIGSVLGLKRPLWLGIAAVSVFAPMREKINFRAEYRVIGNIFGSILFLFIYFAVPNEILKYMGIIGAIGLFLSSKYGWQAAFNALSALAVATPILGVETAVFYRIFNNVFGAFYVLFFDQISEKMLLSASRLQKSADRRLNKTTSRLRSAFSERYYTL